MGGAYDRAGRNSKVLVQPTPQSFVLLQGLSPPAGPSQSDEEPGMQCLIQSVACREPSQVRECGIVAAARRSRVRELQSHPSVLLGQRDHCRMFPQSIDVRDRLLPPKTERRLERIACGGQ